MNESVHSDGNRKRMTTMGIIAVILGLIVMAMPIFTIQSIVKIIGIFVTAGGVVRMIWAFKAKRLDKGLMIFTIGTLTLICGLVLLVHPLFASGLLTILLAFYFILDGIFELVAGFRVRPDSDWGWLVFSGIVSLLLGIMIWQQFPLAGFWAIGVLLGIKLILGGIIMITTGAVARKAL